MRRVPHADCEPLFSYAISYRAPLGWSQLRGRVAAMPTASTCIVTTHWQLAAGRDIWCRDASMPIRIAWRIRGEERELAALSQVSRTMAAVCKTVGFAYPGSNPGPATTSENSLLISPCSGEGLVFGCPVASGGNRPATAGPGEYVATSHIMAVVTAEGMVHRLQVDWCPERRIQRCSTLCAETCPYRLRRGPVDEHVGRRVGVARGAQPTIGVRTPGQAKQIAALRPIRSTWPPRRRRQPTQLSWRSR